MSEREKLERDYPLVFRVMGTIRAPAGATKETVRGVLRRYVRALEVESIVKVEGPR